MHFEKVLAVLVFSGLLFVSSVISAEKAGSTDATTSATKKTTVALPGDGPTWTVIGEVPGIKNFVVRYHDSFYRGGTLERSEAVWFLKQRGITKVFSITPDDNERKILSEAGIALVEVPFSKDKVPVEMFEKFIIEATSHSGPFYVHCLGGKQRGGILSAAYRIKVDKFPFEKAVREFVSLGGDEKVDSALIGSLKKFVGLSANLK